MTVEDDRTPGKQSALRRAAEEFEKHPDEVLTGAEVAERLRAQAEGL
ncbi:hypothetical protein [Lentzea guizhouensis]|nr:hypothetical protein [Lentzea guizhouensis]